MKKNFIIFLAFLPALLLAFLIFNYGVNVPFWDDWELAALFEKISHGQLTASDLFSQQVESREFFPRLISIALAYLSRWDLRYEMWFSFLLACIISLNIYKLNTLTIRCSQAKRFIIILLSNLFIFSPIQAYNFLQGHQLLVFMPIACITTCLVISYLNEITILRKFIICALLCTISAFSMANGMMSWVLILPVIMLSNRRQGKNISKEKWLIAGWALMFLLNIFFYFYKYARPQGYPSGIEIFNKPMESIKYFLALLGYPLFDGILDMSPAMGFLILIITLGLTHFLIFRIKDSHTRYRAAGWLAIAAYSTMSSAMITLGRFGLCPTHTAVHDRYSSSSLYLIVSLINLSPIFSEQIKRKSRYFAYQKIAGRVIIFSAILFFILQTTIVYFIGVKIMDFTKQLRLKGKAYLLLINLEYKKEGLENLVYPYMSQKKNMVNFINSMGFLNPPLIQSNKIKDIAAGNRPGLDYGNFESLVKTDGDKYSASGWAVLPHRGEPADAVILTYQDGALEPVIFKVAYLTVERKDIARTYNNSSYLFSAWKGSFSSNGLPATSLNISAWAFDATNGKAYKLKTTHSTFSIGKP